MPCLEKRVAILPGARGSRGAMGPTGTKGPTGFPGPVGPTGTRGARGSTGPTGARGPTGRPGTINFPIIMGPLTCNSLLNYNGNQGFTFGDITDGTLNESSSLFFCQPNMQLSSSALSEVGGTECGQRVLQIVSDQVGWTMKYRLYIFDDEETSSSLLLQVIPFDTALATTFYECPSGGSLWNASTSSFTAGRDSIFSFEAQLTFRLEEQPPSPIIGTRSDLIQLSLVQTTDGGFTWQQITSQTLTVFQDDVWMAIFGQATGVSSHEPELFSMPLKYIGAVAGGTEFRLAITVAQFGGGRNVLFTEKILSITEL